MIAFDEIDDRLSTLGLDRAWLAANTPYSADYIRTVLAPNSTRRTERVMKILSETIEREEAAQRAKAEAPAPLLPNRINLEPTVEEFEAWDRASRAAGAESLSSWSIAELNAAAEAWFAKVQRFDDHRVTTFPEVPLLRAAAGLPILADAEMVQPDRELGSGRFLLELRGDSMEPRFRDRQRVVLREKTSLKRPVLKYGELYCFVHEGEACFKQWAKDGQGRKVLRSLNPDHTDIPADEATEWIGWFDPADNE